MKTLRTPIISLLVLLTLLPIFSCSEDKDESIVCEDPDVWAELNILVKGELCDLKLPGKYTDDPNEYPVFLVKEWKGLDSDSISQKSYLRLREGLEYTERELCVLMPEDYKSPVEDGAEFSMAIHVQGFGVAKKKLLVYFVDYLDLSESDEAETCGTRAPENPTIYPSSRASIISDKVVNIFVHIVRSTAGVGLNKEIYGLTALQQLNDFFANCHMEFSLLGTDYLDIMTDSWLQTFSVMNESDKQKIASYNPHSNALDIYYISGYDSSVANGVALGIPSTALILKGINLPTSTLSHEVGHCLGLLHTHHGTDPKDGGGVPELVDGSNSAVAGDLIVDTPADPNLWDAGRYVGGNVTDANGQRYNPDPSNLMSYSGGYRYFFSRGQIERMHQAIAAESVLKSVIAKKTLPTSFHFSGNKTIQVSGLYSTDQVDWKIGRSSSSPTNLTYTTTTGNSVTLSSSSSEYFTITATVTDSQGNVTQLATKATSGPPSPSIGTLAWSVGANGQSGGTNAQNYGSPLSVSGTTNVRLEYLDPASVSLPGINFTCVTATNRTLRGTTFQLSQADCANGFLKIRASDNCGTSTDYFTIITEVSGSYYTVNVESGAITIEGRVGNASPVSGSFQAPAKAPVISSVDIYDSSDKLVLHKEASSVSSLEIPIAGLNKGDYKAIISDGTEINEVLFAI